MLMPSIFGERFFDDFMNDFAFPSWNGARYGKGASNVMRTDVKETDQGYELDIDLPGFKKEDVTAQLKNGYLTINASVDTNKEETEDNENYIRRERYVGSMTRSFYVGEDITEQDIQAKFENGILKMSIPKKEPKKIEENRYIAIEG